MKLLFDENLSHRLVERLADIYPGSQHVRQLGVIHGTSRMVSIDVSRRALRRIASRQTFVAIL